MDHGADAAHRHAEALLAHGELAAAEDLIRRLLAIYTYAGDQHRRGWAYARLAAIHLARGRRGPALRDNVNALRRLDPERDPHLFDDAVHALARLFAEGGPDVARFRRLVGEIRQRRWTPRSRPWALCRYLEGTAQLAGGRARRAAPLRAGAPALAHGRTARLAARDTLEALERLDVAPELAAAFEAYVEVLTAGEPVAEAAARVRAACGA